MTTLENILQDIENGVYGTKGVEKVHMIMRGDEGYVPIHWCLDIIKKHLACEKNAETERQSQDNDGWIACSERMPECEQEVYILTERGTETTALYEDGKTLESKSKWHWTDIEGEWDDEEDCMIIPEGWWEYRHFNPDDVYNNVVDEKVIAWRPLPEPYKPPVESKEEKSMREREEFFSEV